jgi:hypothetical protein
MALNDFRPLQFVKRLHLGAIVLNVGIQDRFIHAIGSHATSYLPLLCFFSFQNHRLSVNFVWAERDFCALHWRVAEARRLRI